MIERSIAEPSEPFGIRTCESYEAQDQLGACRRCICRQAVYAIHAALERHWRTEARLAKKDVPTVPIGRLQMRSLPRSTMTLAESLAVRQT
jgi:hypothetical protein